MCEEPGSLVLLGTVTITLGTYSHELLEMQGGAASAMDDALA